MLKADPAAFSQTLRFEKTGGELKLTADSTVSFGSAAVHEESHLNLNGTETVQPFTPGMTASFQRIDDLTFDIIVKGNNKDTNGVGVNRFALSPDGKTLIETKTATYREVVTKGADPTKGAVLRISTSVLVFDKRF